MASLAWLASACAPSDGDDEFTAPVPPDGATLVLAVGDLEVFEMPGTEVCRGTLDRIERHADALSEIFGAAPPRARLFLYGTVESVSAVCETAVDVVGGCAGPGYAHAVPYSALHELVHLYARSEVGGVTWPGLGEGLADRMEGAREIVRPDPLPSSIRDWVTASAVDLQRDAAKHFAAWAIEEFETTQFLHASREVAMADEASVPSTLATALGFSNVEALDEAYRSTSAHVYPSYPDTVLSRSADELLAGFELQASCSSVYTEGPSDGVLTTVVGLDIEVTGEAVVTYGDFPLLEFPLLWTRTSPYDGDIAYKDVQPCPYVTDEPRFDFSHTGRWQLVVDHALGVEYNTTLQVVPLGNEMCTGE